MKLSSIFLFLFLIVCIPNIATCDVCFDGNTAGDIVTELEKSRIIEQENKLLRDGNIELEKHIVLLEKIIVLKDKQLKIEEQTVDRYSELIKQQGELCDIAIKKAKPSFFDRLRDMSFGAILGTILTIGIIAL
jgi:hypothetical protein